MGLLAVVVYLYTVVAFNFFRKFYNKSEDEDEPDMKCDDMMTVSISRIFLKKCLSFLTFLLTSLLVCTVLLIPHVRWGESRRRHRG